MHFQGLAVWKTLVEEKVTEADATYDSKLRDLMYRVVLDRRYTVSLDDAEYRCF